MNRMPFNLTSGHALLLLIAVFALGSVFASNLLVQSISGQISMFALSMIALFLGARAARSAESHRQQSIRYAIFVFGGLVAAIVVGRSWVEGLLISTIGYFLPDLAVQIKEAFPDDPGVIDLIIVFLMYAVTMVYLKDPSATGQIKRDPSIKEASYLERRAAFVSVLESNLRRVDEDLRWHHRDFVELRAEVDVRNGDRPKRRVVDLVDALKRNQDADIFVVLGVPGAGKSVALRKCCIDLLAKQRADERIPVYINLKEWLTNRSWSFDQPPTHDEFAEFVLRNVRDRMPDRSRTFFDDHFERMKEAGELFFMFDSFDEIPGILDADETSKLLDIVSSIIISYLRAHPNARGVIASRHYRRPRLAQERHAQLEIRPFADRQIAHLIDHGTSRAEALKRILFAKRPELGAIARNPFTLSLILLYWESKREAPPNQSALFAAYIKQSLKDADEIAQSLGLDEPRLLHAMAEISWAMFESSSHGLEMNLNDLRKTLGRDDLNDLVDTLVAARLVRKAPRTQAVSFMHRRFNEYFLVSKWLSGERKPPFDAVPTDSRYRDALVLYAEVTNDAEARALAEYCWREMKDFHPDLMKESNGPLRVLRAVHCLRFLTEAFRVRDEPLVHFRDHLDRMVIALLNETDDLLYQKIAVEAAGRLDPEAAETVLIDALDKGNAWLQEAAFGACRFIQKLPDRVSKRLNEVLSSRHRSEILYPDKDFKFVLSVSEVFKPTYLFYRYLRFDSLKELFAILLLFLLAYPEIMENDEKMEIFMLFLMIFGFYFKFQIGYRVFSIPFIFMDRSGIDSISDSVFSVLYNPIIFF